MSMPRNPHVTPTDSALDCLIGADATIALCVSDCHDTNFIDALCALRAARHRLDSAESWLRIAMLDAEVAKVATAKELA